MRYRVRDIAIGFVRRKFNATKLSAVQDGSFRANFGDGAPGARPVKPAMLHILA